MSLSSDIKLPRDVAPKFPDSCVVCEQKPDSAARISHNSQNPLLVFLIPLLYIFGWQRLSVPCCKRCKWRFHMQRIGRELTMIAVVIVAIWWLIPQFEDWSSLARKLAIGGLCLVILIPWISWEVFFPRYFDTTASKKNVSYEFLSSNYATCFANLNTEHLLSVSIEGVGEMDADDFKADADADAEQWYDKKSAWMEEILGPEHDTVLHAIIPYAVGGALDIYYYLQESRTGRGTCMATKELSPLPTSAPSNDKFSCYELVICTRHPMATKTSSDDNQGAYDTAEQKMRRILHHIAMYTEQAILNPLETCEFPEEMDELGGRCLIFDDFGSRGDSEVECFGILLVMEVHRSEMQYAREQGTANLISKLKDAGHYPYSDTDRIPVV